MERKLTVNYQQGTTLLNRTGINYPEKFNEDMKFSPSVRATFSRNARQLFKAIKRVSPGFRQRPKMNPVFGSPLNWREIPWPTGPDGKTPAHLKEKEPEQKVIDLYKTEEIDLNSYASDAVAAILLLLSHPDSDECLSPMAQEEVVWPVAEQLGLVPWLEKKTGITSGQTIEVEYADEKKGGNGSQKEEHDPVPSESSS